VTDPRVSKVGFTGSTAVGADIMRRCADNITRVSLELGGKSANVVFADADMERCVEESTWAIFGNTGQDCTSRSRTLVERPVYEEFVERLAERTSKLRVGRPEEESTDLGPMISASQRQTSIDYVAVGVEEGARLVAGGDVPAEPEGGFYLRPAILADVDNSWRVAQDEIFGPVACVMPFDTEDEAVRLANDTDYGLGATVWSGNADKANRVAGKLEAGAVFINDFVRSDPRAPFGGVKGSGFGRELGGLGARELTNAKLVWGGA
jgi:acyl-CoA reductase-like NAD-dependent aldehyde dehydrogenase